MRRRRAAWLAAALLLPALVAATPAAVAAAAQTQTDQQAQARRKLEAVRAQIKALVAQRQRTHAARDALDARLARQAQALSQAAEASAAARDAVTAQQAKLDELKAQMAAVQDRLHRQRQALGELLRAAYALGRGSELPMLLEALDRCPAPATSAAGEPPRGDATTPSCASGARALAQVDRALAYSRYFQRDRVQRIRGLLADLKRLKSLRADIDARQAALAEALQQQQARLASLQGQREQQRRALARADAALRTQGTRLERLKRDQQELEALLRRLRDVFADLPRQLPGEVPFAGLRGKLPWPAHGALHPHHAGVLIAARPGSEVRAVAHGRVVYANWLRGYGMLLIIDHGDGWLSLYGDNETLRRDVGDWVDAGTVIATSGRGSAGTGVYFGLRHKGQAVDPRPWLAGGRE
ncbi:MAG TPA: peptidoglycan DD-metalloendopeptidase family protein [Rhodanobacteraceae bacterium]|nr:peptidoglycan DD-metalloendopeptidase family protein [Rhodanobacteraceae bacterium]